MSGLVSVVLPVYNGADEISDQLRALAAQDYSGAWEVVVADNGSSDHTRAVVERFVDRLPRLRIVDASARQGGAAACNQGIESAHGSLIAVCDHDDVVSESWLSCLVATAEEADLVVGAFTLFSTDGEGDVDTADMDSRGALGFLPYGLSSNMLMTAQLFAELGGFDEGYKAAYDLDFCFRAQLGGARFTVEPGARVRKRRREDLKGAFRQHLTYGSHDVRLFVTFRASGMRRRSRQAGRTWAWLLTRSPLLLSAGPNRRAWLRVFGHSLGRLQGSYRYRVLYL